MSVMRSLPRLLPFAALLVLLLAGVGFVEHDPSEDMTMQTDERAVSKSVLPVEVVHEVTYETMPEVRQRLEDAVGEEVDYSLVHICVGSDCMAVDPFRFNR